jgi:membrane protein YdbS with pleckstrin-like domain
MTKRLLNIFRDSLHSFEGQETGEEVVMLLRRHPFYIVLRLSVFGLFSLIPIVIGSLYVIEIAKLELMAWFLALACLWYLFLWLGIFYSLTLYSLNTVIVTDRRIIENIQNGFFNRRISELRFERVQDATVEIGGIIETILHFGDIDIQTAGSINHFIFRQIPRATEVKDQIMHLASNQPTHVDGV